MTTATMGREVRWRGQADACLRQAGCGWALPDVCLLTATLR